MSVYATLDSLGIVLKEISKPIAPYVPYVRSGNLIFLSGHIPWRDEGRPWVGQLGSTMTTAEGADAARSVAVDILSTLHAASGDLDRITRIVRLMVLVNSSPAFTEHHLVANGASTLLKDVFGERGQHVRCAYGVAQIPLGCCVEIEAIAEAAG